ncbi:MAG: DUF2147 domain-containing protein [Spirochaetales bacterium]|nr:DUF2147 domain-containing protein [Spirochaetales bacterium]
MKKAILISLLIVMASALAFAADDVTGVWRGVDDNTGESTMFTYIYEWQGKLYGRMIVIFDGGVMSDPINAPVAKATLWEGDPYYAGMDIIWGLEDRGKRWKRGKIADPDFGKIYDCEIWKEADGRLAVRGKIGPFGRNQYWEPVSSSEYPDGLDFGNPSNWTPVIPKVKK